MSAGQYVVIGARAAGPFHRRNLDLLSALVRRDITARYRRSILGPAWALLTPLCLMALFTMIRSFVNIPSDGIPYMVFSYCALVPWTFFSSAVGRAGPSIIANGSIIKKIAIPREIFPLAAVAQACFDLIMSGLVLAAMMAAYRVPLRWSMLWAVPLAGLTALLAFAVGMAIAALGTYRRDLVLATPLLLQFWLYASPVIYPLSSVPGRYRTLYLLNPMAGLIEGFRGALLKGLAPPTDALLLAAGVTALALLAAWGAFRRASRFFADVV